MPAGAADDPLAEANALNQQGVTLYQKGNYPDAVAAYQRALALREQALGPDHPDVATSLNNLGAAYEAESRFGEAEPLLKRALAIDEKALGPEDAGVATDLNNLAVLYWAEGRYDEAEAPLQRALSIYEKTLGPDAPDLAQSINNLALLYMTEGRYPAAEPLYKRALAIFEKTLGPEHLNVAQALNNLAELYQNEGRYDKAEPLFKRALTIREQVLGGDSPGVAEGLNNLATLYLVEGRYAEGEPLYKRALAIFEKTLGPEHPSVAEGLNNLAELYQNERRYDEAEPLLKRSLAIKEKALGPNHANLALSLNNLAEFYRRQARYAEAEPLYKRALDIREKTLGADHPSVAESLNTLAALCQDQGNLAAAEPLLQRSLAIREAALPPDHPNLAQAFNNIATLYQGEGRNDDALTASAHAVAILEKHLSADSGGRSEASDAERREQRIYFTNYVVIANATAGSDPLRRANAPAETFRVAQMARASSAARAVAGMTARFAAGNDALAAVVRERQDLGDHRRNLDAEIVRAVSQPTAARNSVEEAALRGALDDTERRLAALDQRIASEFPDFAELSNPQPLTADAAQALLTGDEALLVYLTTDQDTWLWLLRRDGIDFYHLPITAPALAHAVSVLRRALDPQLNRDLGPFPTTDAYELFQDLLAPAVPRLAGIDHLLIVPDGALESLPVSVLLTRKPDRAPETPEDHRALAWLARDYAITVLPSVTSLRALRQSPKPTSGSAPFLGIGDPVLGASRVAAAGRGGIAKLPALPETAVELRAIAGTLGADDADLLLGERASEPVLRQMPLDHFRVIEFATHGLMAGELPGLGEPALVLTPPAAPSPDDDGLLTASKIATLKLDADWVVLSACNTAASDGTPEGEGLSGLARAFFYAGARSLLVSNWSVPSGATVKLITDTFDELKKHPEIGRAEALRRAELAMLDPSNSPEFAHPMMWASFVVVGDGR
jgi:CHAT domain-containing protein/tetratricopeptide (TPR) repeat protein